MPPPRDFDLLHVFAAADGGGGEPVAAFLHAEEIGDRERRRIAATAGVPTTVFVEQRGRGAVRAFTPARELPLSLTGLVGVAWLLALFGVPGDRLRGPSGPVRTRSEGSITWVQAAGRGADDLPRLQLETPQAVDDYRASPARPGALQVWAWESRRSGRLRARVLERGEDDPAVEASAVAAVSLCARLGRPIAVSAAGGCVVHARPGPAGTVEVGGRVALVAARALGGGADPTGVKRATEPVSSRSPESDGRRSGRPPGLHHRSEGWHQ